MAENTQEEETPNVSDERLNSFLTELIKRQEGHLIHHEEFTGLKQKFDLGIAEEEKLQMLIDRHIGRAMEYKRTERWDNAIVETERALLFSPLNNEIRLDLAELFMNRSARFGYLQKDLRRSEREINKALILEPGNKKAKEFLKDLHKLKKMLKGKGYNRKYVPLLILLFLILAGALYPRIRRYFHFYRGKEKPLTEQEAAENLPWEEKALAHTASAEMAEDFTMSLVENKVKKDGETGLFSLDIKARLEPVNEDYSLLDIEMFANESSTSLGVISMVPPGEAPLRRGETGLIDQQIPFSGDPDALESVYFTVKEEQKLREEEQVRWKEEEILVLHPLPRDIFLSMESRFVQEIEGYDKNYLFYDLRIRNKGLQPLSVLDLQLQWRDEDHNILSDQEMAFVEDKALPFLPDNKQTRRLMIALNKKDRLKKGNLYIRINTAKQEPEK